RGWATPPRRTATAPHTVLCTINSRLCFFLHLSPPQQKNRGAVAVRRGGVATPLWSGVATPPPHSRTAIGLCGCAATPHGHFGKACDCVWRCCAVWWRSPATPIWQSQIVVAGLRHHAAQPQ